MNQFLRLVLAATVLTVAAPALLAAPTNPWPMPVPQALASAPTNPWPMPVPQAQSALLSMILSFFGL